MEFAAESRPSYPTASYNAPIGPSDESPSVIRDGISQAEQCLSTTHELISLLEKRLDTVLRPVPPQVAKDPAAGRTSAVASHLAGRITILNEGHEHAMARLRDLARRVEV